jgi:putative membrane protein
MIAASVTPVVAADAFKDSDKTFAEKVAVDGMTEVELGRIASEKSKSEKVKEFGNHMVKDHGKANEELKTVASNHGLKLPTQPDAEHQALIDKLKVMNGAEFDNAYLAEMITAHKKAIAALEDECKDGEQSLKSWAEKTLPTIKHHLKMAEEDKSQTHG